MSKLDGTPIRYLDPGCGKIALGYLWVAHPPGEDVLFEYTKEPIFWKKSPPLSKT
jgi:hypothetical protein